MVLLLVFTFTFPLACQPAQETRSITKDQLLEDLRFLVEKVDNVHADPFRLISKKDFQTTIQRLEEEIEQQKQERFSLFESYYPLQKAAALIQDEHTFIDFPLSRLDPEATYFPHGIRVLGNHVYIEKNLIDSGIPEMSELLEINGVPIEAIMDECWKYIHFPLPHAKNNYFGPFFFLFLNGPLFNMTSPWEIGYKTGAEVKSASSEGVSRDVLRQIFAASGQYKKYSIKVNDNDENIPVLDVPSFAFGRFEDYRTFIDNFFTENLNEKAIIIDIRRNPGGNGTWGYYLMDHFNDKPYQILELFEFKVSDEFKRSGYASKAEGKAAGAKIGTYLPLPQKKFREQEFTGKKYEGQVYLLISHATNSAGVVMAAIFKNAGMGTVIGQETAGRVKFSSDPVVMRLPNSKLNLVVPVAVYILPGDNPDRGVIPDIPIEYSIEDIKISRDLEMEYLRQHIK